MLGLTTTAEPVLLALSATLLAIIAPCSLTEMSTHTSCKRRNGWLAVRQLLD